MSCSIAVSELVAEGFADGVAEAFADADAVAGVDAEAEADARSESDPTVADGEAGEESEDAADTRALFCAVALCPCTAAVVTATAITARTAAPIPARLRIRAGQRCPLGPDPC
ncbi:hypothetical protein [Streptacidiphilus carbonis]|uniref:hypothetical protein n=1 Tax=Streptacidiphilus carbonis TaxID=105422 RepID=UPI000AA51B7A|nr:hypothetical protein [Streptacidiphilus carbonis]